MIRSHSGKVSNSRYLRLIAGLAILALLILSVDRNALVSQLTHLRADYLLYAAACIVVATLLGSFNAYLVVAIDSAVSYTKFLACYWFSWALGLVVPGQVGDVATLTVLLKRAGLDWSKIMARAVLDKFISFFVMALLAGLALLRFSAKVEIETDTMVWAVAIVFVVAAVAWYVARKVLASHDVAWIDKIRSGFLDLAGFMSRRPGLVAINFVGTTFKILLIGTAYWYVFKAGGAVNPPWFDVILLVTVSSLVAYIPISFNGLGTVEVTGILLFSFLGLGQELVLSSYLVLRVTVLVIAWLPSLVILAFSGKSSH